MKRLFILLFGLLAFGCSEDTFTTFGDIYGIITDAETGKPIAQVEVGISPNTQTTLSDSNGRYEFTGLDAGQYKISLRATGYEPVSRNVDIAPGIRTMCDFLMQPEEVSENISITPSTLDFGTTQTQLSVSVKNEGDISTEWSLDLGNNSSWLSAAPKSGSLKSGKSVSIVFSVDRDFVAEDKNAVVNVAAFGSSFPITITCSPKSNKSEMVIEPTTLDFGEVLNEQSIKIKNTGNNALTWDAINISSPAISLSSESGSVNGGGSQDVKVMLDRSLFEGDLNTSFIISDGNKDQTIIITAKQPKESSYMEISPAVLDFGEEETEKNFKISNLGNADLNWEIIDTDITCLSFSATEGTIVSGGSKIIKITLDRNLMPKSLNTTIAISDGKQEQTLEIKAIRPENAGVLNLSTNTLDFGETETTLNFEICNTGSADISWEVTDTGSKHLSLSATSGTLTSGGSKNINVTLDRKAMTESISTYIAISDGKNEQTILVTAIKTVPHPIMDIYPTSIDFGEDGTSSDFVISNTGDADLEWYISDNGSDVLSFSSESGKIAPGESRQVTVTLNRKSLKEDLDVDVLISDGTNTKAINVTATYIFVEDYSMVEIVTEEMSEFSLQLVSCKREAEAIVIDYLLTNNSSEDVLWSIYDSIVDDDLYNTYSDKYIKHQLSTKEVNYGNTLYDAPVLSGRTVKGRIWIKSVDSNASMLYVMVEAAYSGSSRLNFKFNNVPIY